MDTRLKQDVVFLRKLSVSGANQVGTEPEYVLSAIFLTAQFQMLHRSSRMIVLNM